MLIKSCNFTENNDLLLDDFILESWGDTLVGIKKKHTKNKKYFSEQEKFQENICIFFYVPDFTLIPLKHYLKKRLVGFIQKAICYRGPFARYESVVCGLWQPSWLSHAWPEPLMDAQCCLLGHPSSCVWKVGTPSLCCKEVAGSDGHAGAACWPCLKEKSVCL